MTAESHLTISGLHLEENPYADVPDGALRVASDCVCERPGIIEPRPGFAKSSYSDGVTLPKRLFPWGTSLLSVNASTTSWANALGTPIKTEAGADLSWPAYRRRVAEDRGNLYLNTSDGTRKVSTTSDVVAPLAGFDALPVVYVSQDHTGTFLPAGYYVAYAAILARKDVNGVVVRSALSGFAIYQNNTGVAAGATVTIFNPDTLKVGNVVELYRSLTSSVVPSNELFLQSATTITALPTTVLTIIDNTVDGNLGGDLYTNDSQEGIDASNFRGPAAKDIAVYKGSVFLANVTGPQRLQFTRESINAAGSSTKTGFAAGIGARAAVGTLAAGSAIITALTANNGVKVGQIAVVTAATFVGGINLAGAYAVLVTAKSGTQCTVDSNSNTTGNRNIVFYDTIRVDNTYYVADTVENFLAAINSGAQTGGVGAGLAYPSANTKWFAYASGVSAVTTDTGAGPIGVATVTIEERLRGGTAGTVYATHGSEYTPPLPEPNVTGTATAADALPGDIFYSKKEEPEHFQLDFTDPIGDPHEAADRMIATRDALFVFKRDGLWRLSGKAAPDWQFDPFDMNLRLIAPDACCLLGDVIYAFTTRGVKAISDGGGVQHISLPVDSALEAYIRLFVETGATSEGVWMTAEPVRGNILLFLPPQPDPDTTADEANCLVYNVRTQTWCGPWVYGAVAGLAHMVYFVDRLFGAQYATGDLIQQRSSLDDASSGGGLMLNADYEHAVTNIVSVGTDGKTITISATAGWTPDVGDAVRQSSVLYSITAVVDATHFTVHEVGLAASAAATGYSAYQSIVEWQPAGEPNIRSRWREAQIAFDRFSGVDSFSYAFATDLVSSGATQTKTPTGGYQQPVINTVPTPMNLRAFVPPKASRAQTLIPRVTMKQAGAVWALAGLGLTREQQSQRISR